MGCSSSFASCALAFSSFAILLPFFSLLSYNKTNASFAQQLSSLPSIVFTPHSPVLPKRSKKAPKSSPDAWVLLRFGTCTLFRQMGKSMRRHVYVSACFYTVKHTRVRTSLAAGHQIGPAGCERSSAHTFIQGSANVRASARTCVWLKGSIMAQGWK